MNQEDKIVGKLWPRVAGRAPQEWELYWARFQGVQGRRESSQEAETAGVGSAWGEWGRDVGRERVRGTGAAGVCLGGWGAPLYWSARAAVTNTTACET